MGQFPVLQGRIFIPSQYNIDTAYMDYLFFMHDRKISKLLAIVAKHDPFVLYHTLDGTYDYIRNNRNTT